MDRVVMVLIGVDVVMFLALIILAFRMHSLNVFVHRLAVNKPAVASPAMIKAWKKKIRLHQYGSPKHTAYKNRLKSLGEYDGD